MKSGIYFFIFFQFQSLNCQIYECDSLRSVCSRFVNFNPKGIKNFKDYIKKFNKDQFKYVSDKSTLIEIPKYIANDTNILAIDLTNDIAIEIEIANRIFYPDSNYFFESPPYSDPSYCGFRINNNTPFGANIKDTIYSSIKSIKIKNSFAPSRAFEDLLSPNLLEYQLAIKPIAAYYSKCKRYIYIYVYGSKNSCPIDYSYLAKLIFNSRGHYISRIVYRGEFLEHFGFQYCPDFYPY
jgi:hypothetical protein